MHGLMREGRRKLTTGQPVRHRQPKGAATDMLDLPHSAACSLLYRFMGEMERWATVIKAAGIKAE